MSLRRVADPIKKILKIKSEEKKIYHNKGIRPNNMKNNIYNDKEKLTSNNNISINNYFKCNWTKYTNQEA